MPSEGMDSRRPRRTGQPRCREAAQKGVGLSACSQELRCTAPCLYQLPGHTQQGLRAWPVPSAGPSWPADGREALGTAPPRRAVAFTHWRADCGSCHRLTTQESGSGLCCPRAGQPGGAAGQGAPRRAGGHLPLLSAQTMETSSSNSSDTPHVAVAKRGCLTHQRCLSRSGVDTPA